MKAKRTFTIVVAALVVCSVFFLYVLFEGAIRARSEIRSGLDAIENFDQISGVDEEFGFGANTFTHEISSHTIRCYYDDAAEALERKGGDKVVTYRWIDFMGWPRVSTVLEAGNGYIEVQAAQNNDNDSVSIGFIKGEFSCPNAEILPSISLPKGTLRSN